MKVIKSGNTGRVLEGEEKNAVLREALKQQGYSDSDIATMLGQSKKSIKSSSDEFDDEDNFVMKPTWRKNSEYENIGESDEDVKNEVRDAYDESKGAYEFNSRKASNGKKSIKSVRVVKDMNFRDFEPWSGAKSTYDVIMSEGKDDEMDAMLNEMYPDGLTDTELNDLLWFDSDSVFEWLGIKTGDSGIPDNYEFEEDERSSYPRARRREESDDEMLGNACKKNSKKKDKKKKKSIKSGVENGGRVLEGEEKNEVLRMALKQQGYSDSDIGAMLGQNRKSIKSMANYSLEPQRDSRKSFYGKARVDTGDDNSGNKLYSYDTLVAEIIDGEPVLYDKWDYSPTTMRHVREWLDQNGFEVGSKEFISKTYRHA